MIAEGSKHAKIMVVIDSGSFLTLGMKGQVKCIALCDTICTVCFDCILILMNLLGLLVHILKN